MVGARNLPCEAPGLTTGGFWREGLRLRIGWWLTLAALAAALGLAVAGNVTARLDYTLYDLLLRDQSRRVDPRILIVAIDERSLMEQGAWPWPRQTEARLVRQIARGAPRAVALDLLLSEPGDKAGDAALAAAIAEAGNVWLPVHFEVPGPNGAPYRLAEPLPALAQGVAGVGHVNLLPDADGVVRRLFLDYRDGPLGWQQLVAAMAGRRQPQDGPAEGGLEASHPVMIPYVRGPGGFPAVSASAVIRGEVPAEMLRGRYVIVGATAAGLGDSYATPLGDDGTLLPGIEIQANLLNALLTGQVITHAPLAARLGFALAPVLALWLMLGRLPLRAAPVMIGGMLALMVGASYALLALWHLWMAPVSALIALALTYPLWAWRRLVSASAHIAAELERLAGEDDLLQRPAPALPTADPLERQFALLHAAIAREADLRRFLIDRIAQMPDAVLVTQVTGRVVLANDKARALYAGLGGGALSHADALLGLIRPVDGEAPLRFAWPAEGAAPPPPLDVTGETASGLTLALRFEPQYSHAGALAGFVLRIADITRATVMQRQRDDILQLLSHDMRSPQASIITLLDQAPATEPELARRIRGYARRTLQLADDFVHLSRAELMPLKPVVLDLAALAQEAADMLWPQARAAGLRITLEAPDDEVLVRADASLLSRALVNLIDNAVKFSPAGGVVAVALAAGSGEARLSIRDEGLGIAPEQQAVLFEKFRRAPSGPAMKIGGSGLGLAFVHTVVTRLGGTIACTSAPGQGTTFVLSLPLA